MNRNESLIHPSAIVHPRARLAEGVQVGPFSFVGENVSVGKNTKISAHVYLDGLTQIGESNFISPFCTIGTYPQDISYKGEETTVSIGDGNTFRECITVHRGTINGRSTTEIGSNNYFMAYSHIAHDCRVGDEVIFINGATLGGHVTVDDHAQVGALTPVHQFCRIGAYAFVGGTSTIVQDVLPFSKVAGGRPTLFYGLNVLGLRRKGFSRERIRALKDMFKIIFYSNLNTTQALNRIEEEFPPSEDRETLFRFIKSSKRGIIKKPGDKWLERLE